MQAGGRAGLATESADLGRFLTEVIREDLQGHMPSERLLDGFIDDPHAAAADLAQDQEVPELPRYRQPFARAAAERGRVPLQREVLLDHNQGGEQFADLIRESGIAGRVLLDARPFPRPESRQEGFDE